MRLIYSFYLRGTSAHNADRCVDRCTWSKNTRSNRSPKCPTWQSIDGRYTSVGLFANIVVGQFQFQLPVTNAETSTSEGKVSRDRAMHSLFDRAAVAQPARATARRLRGGISKVERGSELCGYEGFGLGESGRNARGI
jgi:hypothetical protein